MTGREATREECLLWLRTTGKSQSACLDELMPWLSDEERALWENRLRKWVYRDRKAGGSSVAAPLAGPAPAAPTPQPRAGNRETTAEVLDPDGDQVAFLSAYLRDLLSDLAEARRSGRHRDARQLDRPILEVRERLQRERERERGVVRLPRTPAAISAELARRTTAIALRAEMHRRATERAEADE